MDKSASLDFIDNDLTSEVIPTFFFSQVVQILKELGKDPSGIIKNTHISLEHLCSADTRISYQQAVTLFRNALEISEDPALGLTIGSRQRTNDWGLLGYALGTCKNGLEAMELGSRYIKATTSLVRASLQPVNGGHALQFIPLHPLGELLPFVIEKALSSVVTFSTSIGKTPAYPIDVKLTYAPPDHADKYHRFFKCPIHFNSDQNSLTLRDQDLLQPFPSYNPTTSQLAKKLCEQELKTQQQMCEADLAHQIYYRLLQTPGKFPTKQEIADDLKVSNRTIGRSLQALGTTFQAILDGARKTLAIEYLKNSDLTLEDIAHLVGFSDAGNFYRAFKKWTGETPSSYRKK